MAPRALRRRQVLALGAGVAATGLGGCTPAQSGLGAVPAAWIGADAARGHRVREAVPAGTPAGTARRAQVLVVGAGIAGLGCARALVLAGLDDVHLLELEDEAGGNARGHRIEGIGCPRGAHYLPLPGAAAHEVAALLHELGLARSAFGRTVWDERHLCHAPQERLWYDGAWVEGLLPPADDAPSTLAQYRRFAARLRELAQHVAFAMPSLRLPWTAAHAALDAQPFAAWLDAEGFDDARLRWYLDYTCRDDYGADARGVSAWAGLHYHAARQGFAAPGEAEPPEPVLTWPEGNAWLVQRLAAPLAGRVHGGRVVRRVQANRHEVGVLAWDAAGGRFETWLARHVVLAVPLPVAARLVDAAEAAAPLAAAAARLRHAPWLVANLHLREPLLERVGMAPAWDNVVYGSTALGWVDARHQDLARHGGPTVLTTYTALAPEERAALLQGDAGTWARRAGADLAALQPDLAGKCTRIDLVRWGHAMSVPAPGVRGAPELAALATPRGRLHFAHADLSGYSVFEEAYAHGLRAAREVQAALARR